ncbi:hypothetical protein [Deinococcus navajonensis]|uniref:PEGA domain-containing protein n=1 Tax=Deinococcus navajonensis TaxID=309884 RepID=A0ABV8XVZ4_9DEIO
MKPIGPYVAARELPGPAGAVRTLRATDRLTGMPVLLHLLPGPADLPVLPDHPALLPPTDAGFDGDQAYVATELPPHAQQAADPLLAARGALDALVALHRAGLTHGGITPAQLWSMDGEVRLAGAALPWRTQRASPETDLRDLAATLEALGGLPRPLQALRDVPGQLSAQAALDQLTAGVTAPDAPVLPVAAGASPPALREARPHDGSPIVIGDGPEAPVPEQKPAAPEPTVSLPAAPDYPMTSGHASPVQTIVVQALRPGPSEPGPVADHAAPAQPGRETPQERRRRENEARRAQAILDAQAGARRKAERLKAQAEQAAASPAVPEPIRIGFSDVAEEVPEDLPPWPQAGTAEPTPRLHLRTVERLPASLRRNTAPVAEATEAPAAEPLSAPAVQAEPGRLPARRVAHEPIRIGWDEDDSWRVVREPEGQSSPRPLSPPRWVLPLLAALVLLTLGLWAAWSLSARQTAPVSPARTAPAAPCCDVRFALRGTQAKVVVLSAPQDANLTPGQTLGHAPGVIRFPLKGRYRLRVEADGYSPAVLNLNVPRARPVEIALGP